MFGEQPQSLKQKLDLLEAEIEKGKQGEKRFLEERSENQRMIAKLEGEYENLFNTILQSFILIWSKHR